MSRRGSFWSSSTAAASNRQTRNPTRRFSGPGRSVVDVLEVLRITLIVLWTIFLYEMLRLLVKRTIKKKFEKDLETFLKSPDLYQQRFKFTNRLIVQNQLLSDPEVNEAILEFAEREDVAIEQVRERVEGYIEEIVPNFNLMSYYKLGYTVARGFVHLLYDPVVDRESRRVIDELPDDVSPVYVINHRSNMDFVLLAYILAGKVSVSYAVGEWARVWPLEHLFKSFGSYLIRRGYKEDLYHTVLRRYVQLTTKHGVAQAFFPEGRLTRDGYLLEPKMGLMNWLAGVQAEPGFTGRVVFIPVGVNYDWVLEDENLVHEAEGRKEEKKGWAKKIGVIVIGPFVFFGLMIINGLRRLFRRHKLHGYASLSFGEPVVLKEFMAERGVPFEALDYEERKPHVAALAERVMEHLGRAVPATPVAMLSAALLDRDLPDFSRIEASAWIGSMHSTLRADGVPFVHGSEFEEIRQALEEAERGTKIRARELQEVEIGLVASEEAEQTVDLALDVMRRNDILEKAGDRYRIRQGKRNFVVYYANSIAHHLGRRYDVTPAAGRTADGPADAGGT